MEVDFVAVKTSRFNSVQHPKIPAVESKGVPRAAAQFNKAATTKKIHMFRRNLILISLFAISKGSFPACILKGGQRCGSFFVIPQPEVRERHKGMRHKLVSATSAMKNHQPDPLIIRNY
jgi:hypothetical protein